MQQQKVAFICPLYDMKNHFDYAFNLLKSKNDLGIEEDLYFIFSNEEQYVKFDRQVYNLLKCHIKYLIIDAELLDLKAKVIIKKFFGLRKLMGFYEYISIIDCECLFFKNGDYTKLFEKIWQKRTAFITNFSLLGFFSLRTCLRTLDLYDNKKLQKVFKHCRYNFWFNDIPVYKCDILPDFFMWLDKFDIKKWGNEWQCYEYYIFAAYLILKKNYQLEYTSYYASMGVVEYLIAFPEKKQREILDVLGTHWSSIPHVTNENTYLLFHLDRTKKYSPVPFLVRKFKWTILNFGLYNLMYLTLLMDKLHLGRLASTLVRRLIGY